MVSESDKFSPERSPVIRALPFFFSKRFLLLIPALMAMGLIVKLYFTSSFWALFSLNLALAVLAIIDYLYCSHISGISVERSHLRPLAARAENEIRLEAINKNLEEVLVRIQDDIPHNCATRGHPLYLRVPGQGAVKAAYGLTPKIRGDGEFGSIHFWVMGPMGLIWRRSESKAATKAKFYPGLAAIKGGGLKLQWPKANDPIRASWKRGAGGEFDSLRDYSSGDDYRLIHWSSTARRGKLTVRVNRIEMSQNLFMILDAGRMMTARAEGLTKMDHAINAAIALGAHALELGDRVGVMALAGEALTFIPPAKAPGQLARIMDALYNIEPRMEEPRYFMAAKAMASAFKRRSLVVIFTDVVDQRTSEGLLRLTLSLFPRHLPLVTAMRDPEVAGLADMNPKNVRDLYVSGVAAETIHRRELLVSKLRTMGAMVIDTAPSRISGETLDQYLDIKLKGRL